MRTELNLSLTLTVVASAWAFAPWRITQDLGPDLTALWAGTGLIVVLSFFTATRWLFLDDAEPTSARIRRLKPRRRTRTFMKCIYQYKAQTIAYAGYLIWFVAHLIDPMLPRRDGGALLSLLTAVACCGPALLLAVVVLIDDCDRFGSIVFFGARLRITNPPRTLRSIDACGLRTLVNAITIVLFAGSLAIAVSTWYATPLDVLHAAMFSGLQVAFAMALFGILHWYVLTLYRRAKQVFSPQASNRRPAGLQPNITLADRLGD